METLLNEVKLDLLAYIESFNSEDIDGVLTHISDILEISVDGKNMLQLPEGRDALIESYKTDFSVHKRVTISREPALSLKEDGSVEADVELSFELEGKRTSLDVKYIYDQDSKQQRQHRISNVRIVDLENLTKKKSSSLCQQLLVL